MTFKSLLTVLLSVTTLLLQAQSLPSESEKVKGGTLTIKPVTHATLVLGFHGKNIFIDPTGGVEAFKGISAPGLVLVTDIHGDHFDPKTIEAINTANAVLVVPQAVADKFPSTLDKKNLIIMKNGDRINRAGILIEAIPMYNLPEAADAFHTKGRGNGYVLTIGGKKVYISGDTEDIPEMRALKNIDIAFVCMNLPYTMDVAQAAQGVLAFSPKVVYPYHFRGQDANEFKKLVNTGNKKIEVRVRNWYPAAK
ncbi:MAG: MBL fold metallo-hydrolase [Chitinophagaceae bacterium]